MSKTARAVTAIALLVAFIGWIFMTVIPFGELEPAPRTERSGSDTYEPKFKDEGDLFVVSEGDTLKKIEIELANTPERIQYGMMYRKTLNEDHGMLFFMGEERPLSFWMKNTYVPLDIIFIDSDQKVVSIQKNAQPLSQTSLSSEGSASFVLEVAGGFSDKHGLKKGDRVYFSEH